MWYNFGNSSLDLKDVSTVVLEEEEERVVVTMKSGQQVFCEAIENVTPPIIYEAITGLLKAMRERDDRRITNISELLDRIHSELQLISQSVRRLS